MPELELETTGYQVEVVGEPAPLGKKLMVNGHDISSITRGIDIYVPANGMVEARVYLLPMSFLAKTNIEVESLRFLVDGIEALLDRSRTAAKKLDSEGHNELARQLMAAVDSVEVGL